MTTKDLLHRAGDAAGGIWLLTDHPVDGVQRICLSSRLSRLNGMEVSVYRIGDLLIDSGFLHARAPLARLLEATPLSAICLTHHHEDHSGACGALARRHGCPVYLRNSGRRFEEGLSDLWPYRRLWWGEPSPYEPAEMPERIDAGGRTLRAVPIPGHSVTHTALLDESSGVAFTGDLFISGGATAVMTHENPFESVASLRRVAELEPEWMLTGHGLAIRAPAATLRRKADAIEQAATRVLSLHAEGLPVARIVRTLFSRGRARDLWSALLTSREFSRANFVRACLRHAPAASSIREC